jgi:hypothetical protein
MVSTKKQQQAQQSALTASRPAAADPGPARAGADGIQGEGNYEAARHFNDAERRFVASGKVDAAARAAAPHSEAEEKELLEAEAAGKRRAKEEDPALTRPRPRSGKDA